MSYDDLRPWDRQPRETEKAYAAFKAYLDMSADGGERNLSELARRLSKSRQLLTGWKSRHHWGDRCLAWDKTVMEAERKAAIKERKKMVKRHIGVAMALQSKAVEALKYADVDEAGLKDIVTMIVQGVKIERLTRELLTEEQKLRNEKLRAEVNTLNGANKDDHIEITIRKKESRDGSQ